MVQFEESNPAPLYISAQALPRPGPGPDLVNTVEGQGQGNGAHSSASAAQDASDVATPAEMTAMTSRETGVQRQKKRDITQRMEEWTAHQGARGAVRHNFNQTHALGNIGNLRACGYARVALRLGLSGHRAKNGSNNETRRQHI